MKFLTAVAIWLTYGEVCGRAAEICVENATDVPRYFAVETRDGTRAASWLAASARLRLPESGGPGGTVAAFEGPDSLEGCSRLVGPGGSDSLLAFANFDRCHWSSHD